MGGVSWRQFFADCALKDVLDFVTVAYWYQYTKRGTGIVEHDPWDRWCREVQRIFQEENLHYGVDQRGGVHFRFDAEFEHNRAITIACLQDACYRNALSEFEGAMASLAKVPPDGKAAIRRTFSAAETLFRLMFPNSPRLTAQDAQRLEPVLQRLHTNDKVATGAAIKLLSTFKDWIEAAHYYRHEAGHAEPTQPPLMLAVEMVSIGASFIRWLGELEPKLARTAGA
jgi:hypothetical protein